MGAAPAADLGPDRASGPGLGGEREAHEDGSAFLLLALMVFLAPAIGATSRLMLQDTLKSIVVAFCTLVAALHFFRARRRSQAPVYWHPVVGLPLLLMAHALGSMAWSHAYLAGVEAVRWFVFALIVWLGANVLTRERLPALAWSIHAGALVASLWAVLQFWTGFSLFPQGPQPASTFINRNFFAEFVVCTLPFGFGLLARSRKPLAIALLAAGNGLLVVALLMAGTRTALAAMGMQLLLVLPLIAWRCRRELAWSSWPGRWRATAAAGFLGTVLVLGLIPSGNPKIVAEGYGAAPLLRGVARTQSIGPKDASLNLRLEMWRDTVRAIRARPVAGLGAGAWESEIPLYQQQGAQLEVDYYVHNEFLQLVAEYGLVGWLFLLLLFAWLLLAAWRSWRGSSPQEQAERPWRAVFLCSVLALFAVSNFGFPWRLASTGALFALCLGALAASDGRLATDRRPRVRTLPWSRALGSGAVVATGACLVLALYITQRAVESERKLVRATEIALAISASGQPQDPRFEPAKAELLELVREGIALNPHYRKITPMVADELARWEDWENATWVWDSVLASRPHVVAIISNAARGYSSMGQQERAFAYLERARRLQPDAPSVRSLEVILLARSGREREAMERAQAAMAAGIADHDLVNAAYVLARRAGDFPLAIRLLQQRMEQWPESRALGYMQLGLLYAQDLHDSDKALAAFRQGLAAATVAQRAAFLQMVPPALRGQLAATAQTSASSR
jgi:O-antigen ligase